MPTGIASNQIRDVNTVVGDLIALVDGGGGVPKLPAVDGSLLTHISGAAADLDKILISRNTSQVLASRNRGNVLTTR